MKKRIMISVVVFILFSIPSFGFGADFGPDSATLTNKYFPAKVNDWWYSSGYGGWEGHTGYWHAVGTEVVENELVGTVNCLKVNVISTLGNSLITFWFAQDTDGNVWVIKAYVHYYGLTFSLGNGIISWFMPAQPEVGDNAAITVPESASCYCEIVDTDARLLTPFGYLDDCLEVNCFHNGDMDEVEFYAPYFGSVKYYFPQDPGSWWEGAEFHLTFSPEEQIAKILEFFNDSVANEDLVGVGGPGCDAECSLESMKTLLEDAASYIEQDRIEIACSTLQRAYLRCDGEGDRPSNRDFVMGEAREKLANMILDLMASLECK